MLHTIGLIVVFILVAVGIVLLCAAFGYAVGRGVADGLKDRLKEWRQSGE